MNNKLERLQELKNIMQKDLSLPLRKGATNLVFGVGDPDSKILFIGEGPGFWEDQKAEPFVGNAGKLLNQLLYSIELARESVYITNVVHHRPAENRDPLPEEIEAYKKYLDQIINIISPKVVVTLGRFSMAKFLPWAKITTVHGKRQRVNWGGQELTIVPMYHPAAALRNGEIMQKIKDDFSDLKIILEEINKPEISQSRFL